MTRQLLKNLIPLISISIQSKVFVSTGGIVAVLPGLLCFLLNKKIIYVETIAKTEDLTVTGKIFYKITDKFFVQDEALLEKFPEALYCGTLYKI